MPLLPGAAILYSRVTGESWRWILELNGINVQNQVEEAWREQGVGDPGQAEADQVGEGQQVWEDIDENDFQ